MDSRYLCARPYCGKRFKPKTKTQKFCSRYCSFKQLGYGKTAGLKREIEAHRGYRRRNPWD
jgi:DNA-directed RNA polymerase subunit RPC12/RpoP